MSTIQELFQKGRSLLQDFPQPALEAKILLLKSAALSEEKFYALPQKKLSRKEARQFLRLVSKRRSGFPISYLTGIKEFWSIPFRVSPGIFIPRPETELVVEKVLELSSGREGLVIVDIGTGCGNIAIALAKEDLPQARIIATDISKKALKLARLNASWQGISAVTFVQGSLLSPLKKLGLEKGCDFVVSNPPYVSEKEWQELPPEIKNHEPKKAIVPGKTGLEFIQKLIQGAGLFLKPGGYLVVEIGEGQKDEVLSLFGDEWGKAKCFNDLAGHPRAVAKRKS